MKYKNNPANIRSGSKWLGLSDNKNGFCEFIDLSMGVRALLYLLFKYYYVYGLCDVRSIISRFAPTSENNTEKYISFVENRLKSSDNIEPKEFIFEVAQSICLYETSTSISLRYFMSCYFVFRFQLPS